MNYICIRWVFSSNRTKVNLVCGEARNYQNTEAKAEQRSKTIAQRNSRN